MNKMFKSVVIVGAVSLLLVGCGKSEEQKAYEEAVDNMYDVLDDAPTAETKSVEDIEADEQANYDALDAFAYGAQVEGAGEWDDYEGTFDTEDVYEDVKVVAHAVQGQVEEVRVVIDKEALLEDGETNDIARDSIDYLMGDGEYDLHVAKAIDHDEEFGDLYEHETVGDMTIKLEEVEGQVIVTAWK